MWIKNFQHKKNFKSGMVVGAYSLSFGILRKEHKLEVSLSGVERHCLKKMQ